MKIKESRLRQIVKEAIYKEVGKKVINEGRVDEFLGGLFGFGKKKKIKHAKATDAEVWLLLFYTYHLSIKNALLSIKDDKSSIQIHL